MTVHETHESDRACVSNWHKSSYSVEQGECVEVSEGSATGVRDTQNRELGALFFTADEWRAFLETARNESL